MKTVNSITALKAQIMKKMEAAVAETVDGHSKTCTQTLTASTTHPREDIPEPGS